jgi:PPOX class probable F420-dependent enzyme
MVAIPESFKDILTKKSFVHLATKMSDGSPQVSPVWAEFDGDHIVVNSAKGRLKDRNIRADERVALSATDPDNPYRSIMIRGRVTKITEEGADEHIDRLAKKYLNEDKYPFRTPDEVRVKYYIEPIKVATMG